MDVLGRPGAGDLQVKSIRLFQADLCLRPARVDRPSLGFGRSLVKPGGWRAGREKGCFTNSLARG